MNLKHLSMLVIIGAATLLSACGPEQGHGCTMIGCQDQFTLEFEDLQQQPVLGVTGEISFDDQTIEFDCREGSPVDGSYFCYQNKVTFFGAPSQAQFSAFAENLFVNDSLSLTFIEVQPNGPGCDPICLQNSWTYYMYDPEDV